jgi:ribosomal protein S18 acetylase RimI-like enzyme
MNIRKATTADLDDICVLSAQINDQHYQNAPHSFTKPTEGNRDREFWAEILIQENSVFLLAEVNNQAQGFITARLTENTGIPFLVSKKVCRVGTIVVLNKFQGLGIGKLLMKHIEKWAQSEGAEEIRLEVMEFNSNAQKFYDSIGFQTHSHILAKIINEKKS